MNNLNIKVVFQGGLGFVRFTLFHHGHVVQTVVMNGDDPSDNRDLSLAPGLYLISADGVSPARGTTIRFNKPSSPAPTPIAEGPIDTSYAIMIN